MITGWLQPEQALALTRTQALGASPCDKRRLIARLIARALVGSAHTVQCLQGAAQATMCECGWVYIHAHTLCIYHTHIYNIQPGGGCPTYPSSLHQAWMCVCDPVTAPHWAWGRDPGTGLLGRAHSTPACARVVMYGCVCV